MAARHLAAHSDGVRERIKASQLVYRLQRFALADPDAADCPRMTRTQAMVALALLRKVLPDVATLEVTGANGAPIAIEVVRFSDVIDSKAQSGDLIDVTPIELDSVESAEDSRNASAINVLAAPKPVKGTPS